MTKDEIRYFKQFTDPIDCKNRIHNYAMKKFIDKEQRGSLFMSPGSGKTRIGVITAGENIKKYGGKWLISVPKENLIKQWKDEFIKWKYKSTLTNIDFICHASNSKFNPSDYSGVVIDEVHLAIQGDVHGSLLQHDYSSNKLLCLTGTKPQKDLLDKLELVAPCAFELTLNEAVELKLVSEYKISIIEVELEPDERQSYQKAQQSFVYYKQLLGNFDAFEKASAILNNPEANALSKKNALMFYSAIRKRKAVAQNAKEKFNIAKQLIDLYPDDSIITFAETNDFTNKLYKEVGDRALIFHSSLKDSQKQEALKKFKDKRVKKNVLCSTKALSEGFNVPDIETAVICAFTSKSHTLIQRLSRSIRYQDNKQAKIFILCTKKTQEEEWLKTALNNVSSVHYYENFETYKQSL